MVRMEADYIRAMTCVFCTDPSRAGDIVYDDDHALVVLHEDWSARGHAMVAAKRHVENVSDLAADEWAHLAQLFARTERVLLELTGADRAIVMKLGIATPHLHLHIYPVSAELDRAAVMRVVNAKTREARDEQFVASVRRHLTARH
jgi:diadenosine tetraphosphate (Ap4A) HIT family hydrolase